MQNQYPTTLESSPCRASVVGQADGLYSVQFELVNFSESPVTLELYKPFLQFQLRAEANGAVVGVDQPMLDMPLQPITLTLSARQNTTLSSPVQLRIGASAQVSTDPFVWTIAHAPDDLELVFTLDLPSPFNQPCRTSPRSAK